MTTPDPRPLQGIRVLVTRSVTQSQPFKDALKALGASVLNVPMVEFVPPTSWKAADKAIATLDSYQWIVFSSANAVRFFLDRMRQLNSPPNRLHTLRVAVVGRATGEAARNSGLQVNLTPSTFRAEGLISAFAQLGVSGQSFLLPVAEEGREELVRGLQELGATVIAAPVYRTVAPWYLAPALRPAVDLDKVDVIAFFSPSTLHHFLELKTAAEIRVRCESGLRIAVIGPTTREAVTAAGLPVAVMPSEASSEALIEALIESRNPENMVRREI